MTEEKNHVTPGEYLNFVANFFQITPEDIKSKSRKRELVIARAMWCQIVKTELALSLKAMGRFLGNRDHSTVIHALTMFNDCHDTEKIFRLQYKNLLHEVGIMVATQINKSQTENKGATA
jgi:chromosomal replication initiator protein